MKKFEMVWRHILAEALRSKTKKFTQKEIADMVDISTSTVFNALKKPVSLKTVNKTGRYFELIDYEKLLLLWATYRNLDKEIVYQTEIQKPVREIEGLIPADTIPAAYTAYKLEFNDAPADYDKIYLYSEYLDSVKERFPKKEGYNNLVVLRADPYLKDFGDFPPWSQTFTDLWNLKEWYAKPFRSALLEKIKSKLVK